MKHGRTYEGLTSLLLSLLASCLLTACGAGASGRTTAGTPDNTPGGTLETESDADFVASDWTEATHGKNAVPNFDEVFDDSAVKRLDLVIREDRWRLMLDDMTGLYGPFGTRSAGPGLIDADDPIFVPAEVHYNGRQWYRVGIRFKGNSSLQGCWARGILKLSFKLDFDEFEDAYPQIDNQRFYGFKKLSLKNNYDDPSQLREKVAADVFARAGLAVSHTAFYAVYVDHGDGPEYFGLYTLVEEVDDTVIETQFSRGEGNLYKPEGYGARFADGSFDESHFEKKTNEDDEDWSDILALFAALHDDAAGTDPAIWRANLESVFDVDGFLRYLAVSGIIQNWDSYGRMTQNYYLYDDPASSKLTWIPWDHNEAFQEGKQGGAVSLDFSDVVADDWPLMGRLYADAVYKAQYDDHLLDVIGSAFETSAIHALYGIYANLVEPYVTSERAGYTFLRGADDFYDAVSELKAHASNRAAAVDAYLGQRQLER